MELTPTVSVIVPAYNAEQTIKHCLDSVLNQNFKNFELIIVDDGSSDHTRSVVQHIALLDSRVRYFRNLGRKGASSARNLGLDKARGRYIFFLDADDWVHASLFDRLLEASDRTDSDMVISAHVQYRGKLLQRLNDFGRTGETFYEGTGLLDCIFEYLDRPYKNVMLVHCWGKLFKKEIIDRNFLRFEESLHQLEDLSFVFSYLSDVRRVLFIPSGLYFHRIDSNGRSMSSKTGMDDQTPERFNLACRPLGICLEKLWPGHSVEVQKYVDATTASLLLLAILRLCKAFLRNPSRHIYQRIREISVSNYFHISALRPKRDEAWLLYAACYTRISFLVLFAGILRVIYLNIRRLLPTVSVGTAVRDNGSGAVTLPISAEINRG